MLLNTIDDWSPIVGDYYALAATLSCVVSQQTAAVAPTTEDSEEPPEGYYAFVESPNATPPRVRGPPYRQGSAPCPGRGAGRPHVSAHNLCGDLNRGLIPRNPLGQTPDGQPYPFELIRNETLRFLSRTLPVLRADDALPRVAHVANAAAVAGVAGVAGAAGHHTRYDLPRVPDFAGNRLEERAKRSAALEGEVEGEVEGEGDGESPQPAMQHRAAESAEAPRESRKFCDGGGV
ncbi:unnamed protein product, partial [Iphiclides podalirius]